MTEPPTAEMMKVRHPASTTPGFVIVLLGRFQAALVLA
jgi:hypothetical protein